MMRSRLPVKFHCLKMYLCAGADTKRSRICKKSIASLFQSMKITPLMLASNEKYLSLFEIVESNGCCYRSAAFITE